MTTSALSQHVVIVGGGISGLSIAVRLRQAGFQVTLFESSQLGFGASTRNQGWLYSGAWFAPQSITLAEQCYQSLKDTLDFCPACIEPEHSGMIYVLADNAKFADRWTTAWTKAGIPFETLDPQAVLNAIPQWNPQKIHAAWRLPDRAIRTDLLLAHLAKVAKDQGVEIHPGTAVAGLIKKHGQIEGVVTSMGKDMPADFVVLATGGEPSLRAEIAGTLAGDQPGYELVNLKTHLIAIEPGLGQEPFCVLDYGGFNHVPHSGTSIFGANHWTVADRPHDVSVDAAEVRRITDRLGELLPSWDYSRSQVIEWAGTTVQAMHVEQIEPGRVTLPTVIDHESEPGRWKNLFSVFAGRASLWPQLAELTLKAIAKKQGLKNLEIATPPWMEGQA